ncbi:OstA-like protein [Roseivirga sp.]|uniref:OstA-like protein n=1 Tax=Roseivirga sp. TaxID=1964215 RepID=UPI003B516814
MRKITYFLLFLLLSTALFSQTKVTLKKAGTLSLVKRDNQNVQKLKDNVWLVQGNTNIYCDSAYLNQLTNSAQAFGHVRIIDTVDPVNISSDYLEYDGNTRIARLRNHVVMKDDSVTLYTDNLDYNRNTRVGNYFNGGRLVDANNELTSLSGYYFTDTKESEFYDSVEMVNPDFYMDTDTLFYNSNSSLARTKGRTKGITTEGDTLNTTNGLIYNRETQYAEIYEGSISNEDVYIEADTIVADDAKQVYSASQQIKMTSKPDSLTIYGDKGRYLKLRKEAVVYENAYLRKMLEGDSLFISADTLYSNQFEEGNKYLTAYHNVQMFKSNMQGKADSVSYNFADSTIYMYRDPVIWAENSQMTADSINIEVRESKIHKMNLAIDAFVIQQDSSNNFNQVKGRNMEVYFDGGFISKTDVNGNGESIYYIREATGASSMNKMKCSNMALYFSQSTVTEIRTYTEVDGQVKPELEIAPIDRKLRGFLWRSDQRPLLRQVARHLRYDR